ncbi:hypothetical protein CLHOM_09030 [Clostridium homopropionicum DSM 5847]|uniref:Uncharacterized protein n=1 Tax=Clostridium homopropionicum DSM 5847 TaxID=1121318 RepID=A0A0L6ZCR7_9CLOT|nr:hypothetical protein CLHOM_09030 [Clostridium homopropionicum DSM 5847]
MKCPSEFCTEITVGCNGITRYSNKAFINKCLNEVGFYPIRVEPQKIALSLDYYRDKAFYYSQLF